MEGVTIDNTHDSFISSIRLYLYLLRSFKNYGVEGNSLLLGNLFSGLMSPASDKLLVVTEVDILFRSDYIG